VSKITAILLEIQFRDKHLYTLSSAVPTFGPDQRYTTSRKQSREWKTVHLRIRLHKYVLWM